MKAKIKDTVESIEVLPVWNSEGDLVGFLKKTKTRYHPKYELILKVEQGIVKSVEKKIDWEQRRYEIAKDVLAASFATPMGNVSIQSYIRDCVQIADLLIEELKK